MDWSTKACVVFLSFLSLSLSVAAFASEAPLTGSDVLRIFLEESPRARSVPLIVQSVESRFRGEAPVANPSIAYSREEAGGVRDEFLTIEQELPITGRRGLLRERAEVASAAAGLLAERGLQVDAYALKESFYDVLYLERILERQRLGVTLLAEVVAMLGHREREGEASGYDLLRAEQELDMVRIEVEETRAAVAAARQRFSSFFDPARQMSAAELEGDFAPEGSVPDSGAAVELAIAQRGDLRAQLAESERQELEYRVERRRRFPEPVLTAGWKRSVGLDLSDTGFIAALSVPLPIFDRGSRNAERATADRDRAQLEGEILRRDIRAEVLTALDREDAARRTAARYGEAVERRAREMWTIARLSYDEGESGILELLDAHRTSLAMALRVLAVRYEVKNAEIARGRAIGTEVRP